MNRSLQFFGLAVLLLAPRGLWAQSPDEILEQFDAEPTIIEVQEAASAYAHIDNDTMAGWTTRASVAALLPRVRVQYWYRYDDDEQNDDDRDYDATDQGLVLTGVDQDLSLQENTETRIRLQGDWELQELVFNPDIIRISGERSDLVELREDILTTVTSLYFERRRAQVQMALDPPSDAMERLRRELEIQELTAGLDALTGGWFSQQLSQAGMATY